MKERGLTVFFDRDGTLNEDVGYLRSAGELVVFPGVGESLTRINREGGKVAVITNQSGIARGFLTRQDLAHIHEVLGAEIRKAGGWVDGWYFCPHHPQDGCRCRKPEVGMIEQAEEELGVNRVGSYVVGDKDIDMELAQRIGAVGVLVTTSAYGREALIRVKNGTLAVQYVASDVGDAVEWILEGRGEK